jgi:hypothetical protein
VNSYAAVIICELAGVMVPCMALTVMRRPKPFKYVLRGGEAAVCLAFSVDTSRRLALIANGAKIVYPGDIWAVINVTLLTITGLLLWARVAQLVRHDLRNRDHARLGLQELERLGVDTSSIKKPT